MTTKQKAMIHKILLDEKSDGNRVKAICHYIDGEISRVLSESTEIGEILEAVGLEIRAKQGKEVTT